VVPVAPITRRDQIRLGVLTGTLIVGAALVLTRLTRHPDAQGGCGIACLGVLGLLFLVVLALDAWGRRPVAGDPRESQARAWLAAFLGWLLAGVIIIATIFLLVA
jgi:uncharacterized membrane protein YkvI